jgi:hypothetical protein
MSTITHAGRTVLTKRRAPRYVQIAAWSIPVLVLAQFSMVAVAPVAVLTVAAFADSRVRNLRWWIGLVTALYAVPLATWAVRSDPAQSLSKDMHPAFLVLIPLAAALLLVAIYRRRSR